MPQQVYDHSNDPIIDHSSDPIVVHMQRLQGSGNIVLSGSASGTVRIEVTTERVSQLVAEAAQKPTTEKVRVSQAFVEVFQQSDVTTTVARESQVSVEAAYIRITNAGVSQESVEAVAAPTNPTSRITQDTVEANVSPTDANARLSQRPVEANVLPTDAQARASQGAGEAAYIPKGQARASQMVFEVIIGKGPDHSRGWATFVGA